MASGCRALCVLLLAAVSIQGAPVGLCQVSTWGSWSDCSTTCGRGMMSRLRAIETEGPDCPPQAESKECLETNCPVDCKMSAPLDLNPICSKSCGTGFKIIRRSIEREPMYGGVACPDHETFEYCNEHECPIDCKMSAWSDFGKCNKPCGGGTRSATRTRERAAEHGGLECGASEKFEECNHHECTKPCAVGPWTLAKPCTRSCGTGYQKHVRSVTRKATGAGAICPVLLRYSQCNTEHCPIDCKVSEFTGWGQCTQSCGGGYKTKHRSELISTAYGGRACPALTETEECNSAHCSVDCEMTKFGDWSACGKSCGTGLSTRSRSVHVQPVFGGKKCPHHEQSRHCNKHYCPINCEMSEFSGWQPCDLTCGGGTQWKKKRILQPAMYGGTECPPETDHKELRACNTQTCAIDCKLSDWSPWSQCSQSCSKGSQSRTRDILGQPQFGGIACPDATGTGKKDVALRDCNAHCCDGEGLSSISSVCEICLAGQKSFDNVCETCPAAHYSEPGAHKCLSCPAGYIATAGAGKCTACEAGKSNKVESNECLDCDAGSYSSEGAPKCPSCPNGYYSDAGKPSCEACAAGRFVIAVVPAGKVVCKACVAGTGSLKAATKCNTCIAGQYSPGDSKCLTCADGQSQASPGKPKCDKCDTGRFSNAEVGFEICSKCSKGEFADQEGSTTCKDCPDHYFSREEQAGCSECPQGKFHAEDFSSFLYAIGWHGEKCVDYEICGLGKELAGHSTDKNGKCIDCEQEEYQPKANKWDAKCLLCGSCDKGKERTECAIGEEGSCKRCQIGTFKNDPTNQPCEICPKGKYAKARGANKCLSCPAGYIATAGAGKCTACEAGKSNKVQSNKCLGCDAGSYSSEGSPKCNSCPNGYYSDAGDPSCTACLAGTAGEGAVKDSTYCVGCEEGKYQDADGMVECKNCGKGQFSKPKSTVMDSCLDCQPGHHQDKPERGSCKACPEGTFTKLLAQEVCGDCPACPIPGDYRKDCGSANGGSCTQCPDGKYSQIWKCGDHEACPIGKFGAKHEEICHSCPVGKYKETVSTGECSKCDTCPAGYMRIGCTSESKGECVACGKGTYKSAPVDWDTGCLVCDKGDYANKVATHECKTCPAGKHQNGITASEAEVCEKCEPGTSAPAKGTTDCTNCVQGKWNKDWGVAKCKDCNSGRFNEAEKQKVNCKKCPTGKFHITTDLFCTDCKAGKYQDNPGKHTPPNTDDECDVCPGGKWSADIAPKCERCEAGKYETGTQKDGCMHCPKGKFQESDLKQKCDNCESGFHMEFPGAKTCKECRKPLPKSNPDWPVKRFWWTKNLAGALKCEKKPVDCVPGAWSSWNTCSTSCGGGTQSRSRPKVHDGWGGGLLCTSFHWFEEEDCNTHDCPVDCEVSTWEAWDMCSAPCGTGDQKRERAISPPRHGGKACPHSSEEQKCNPHKCTCKAMSCEYREHENTGAYSIHVTHGLGKTSDFGHIPEANGKKHGLAADYFTNDGLHHCKYDRVSETCECTCPGRWSESYTHHRIKDRLVEANGHYHKQPKGLHPGRAVFEPSIQNHTRWALPQHVWPEWHDIKHETGLHGSTDTYSWRATHVPGSVAYRDRLASESSE